MISYPLIDPVKTGENIRITRELNHMSVRDLQSYLHLSSPRVIYHWQAGKALPSLDHFFAMSILWNVSLNDLISIKRLLPAEDM